MNKLVENAENVLKEKKMNQLFFVKHVENYRLPIIKYLITIHFEAREKYNIIENQLLQFVENALNKRLTSAELESLLGVQSFELTQLVEKLVKDGALFVEEETIRLTKEGELSATDGFSPVCKGEKAFDFHFEPVTAYLIEDIRLVKQMNHTVHPVVYAENYEKKDCSRIEEDKIVALHKQVTKNNLLDGKKGFEIKQITHEIEDTNKAVTIQNIELYSTEKATTVRAIWNAANNQLIRLA